MHNKKTLEYNRYENDQLEVSNYFNYDSATPLQILESNSSFNLEASVINRQVHFVY